MEGENSPLVEACNIIIDHEACLTCAACPPVCHTAALNLAGLRLELRRDLCDNCLLCTKVCPTGALRPKMEDL
jgi:ferredoxin